MPIYEYQCEACEAVHEALQKISDPLLKKCPECGKSKLKKLVSAPSFRLSGTGWYETDFKTDKDKKRNLASDDSQKEGQKEGQREGQREGQKEGQKEGKKKADSSESKSKDSKSKSASKESVKKASPDKPKAKSKQSK
jgi:putative FmdB family regulatory protein